MQQTAPFRVGKNENDGNECCVVMITTRPVILALVAAAIGVSGCDAWTDTGQYPLAARILELTADPDPVSVGDTTTLSVVHTDSLDGGFSYYWSVDHGVETAAPHYRWRADVEPGEYFIGVQVRRRGDYLPAPRAFRVTVIDAP